MLLVLLKWALNNTAHVIMRTAPRIFYPIIKLLLHITLLILVLPCPTIQYPMKVPSILGIWTINCLVQPTDMELMGIHRRTREVHESICISSFYNYNIIIMHCMLGSWWLHLLDVLGNYIV